MNCISICLRRAAVTTEHLDKFNIARTFVHLSLRLFRNLSVMAKEKIGY